MMYSAMSIQNSQAAHSPKLLTTGSLFSGGPVWAQTDRPSLRLRSWFDLLLQASERKLITSKRRPYGFCSICDTFCLCSTQHPHGHTLSACSLASADSAIGSPNMPV